MIKITNTSSLIFTLLALLTTTVLLPARASGQSRLESYLRKADLDDNGRIEPNEMTGQIKSYLVGKGYDVSERIKIRDIIKASERVTTPVKPTTSELKVPKFGVEPAKGSGVSSFSTTGETVKYSEEVNKKTRELFERYDRNGNGTLDEGEIQRMNWGSPRPSANDKNGDGRLSYAEIQGRYHDREVAERRSGQKNSRDSAEQEERGGREERGSDDPRERYGRSSQGGTSSDSRGRSDEELMARRRGAQESKFDPVKYVDDYMKSRDKDKNGVLEGNELSGVRTVSKYDTNRDGKIRRNEMLAVISSPSGKSTKSKSKAAAYQNRKSVNTAGNGRQSSGSFSTFDKNKNKLVEMHEFSKTWTEEKLKEFNSKDYNQDGVISAEEWLR